jgi:hypothetical protein
MACRTRALDERGGGLDDRAGIAERDRGAHRRQLALDRAHRERAIRIERQRIRGSRRREPALRGCEAASASTMRPVMSERSRSRSIMLPLVVAR